MRRPDAAAAVLYGGCGCGYATGVEGSAVTAGGVHGFPAALTSFIGRGGPLREVAVLLGRHRLVTVTGPGGAGKTRLAVQVARAVAGEFADGAWLVELAPVRDPAQVPGVVAAALGVRDQPGVPPVEAVARVLARQQLLLVLDNCEHVLGTAAEFRAGLLAAADDVRVLATSREPLRVAGEARYRLGPLTVPGPGDTGECSEAVALFIDRARSADPHFAFDDQAAAEVGRLVTRLDGMPLAIELAAAQVEALGVAQLLDRLDDRFALLAGADRLAAPRQQSLAATVEWSYRLLDEQERRVFRAVSVFPAPFTLEAAEAVAGPGTASAVLHLVDCSLLTPPRPGLDGRARYVMLETLRGYGAGQLAAAGEQDQAAAALAGWALGVADQAAEGLQSSTGEQDAARWLDAEDATMRQVLAWAMGPTGRQRCGWPPRWAGGGSSGAGWPGVSPLLAELAGYAEPGSDRWCTAQFWAGSQRCSRWTRPGRCGISPRCRMRWRTGRRPGRWPTPWPAGHGHCWPWARSQRQPRMPAGVWPSPARSAIRSGRYSRWCSSATPLRMPTTWRRRCGWPGRPISSPATSLPRWPGSPACC